MRLLGVMMVLALAACGRAALIHRDPSGGIFKLGGNRGAAMNDARRQMADHCGPGRFAVTEEGEEAVGTEVSWGRFWSRRSESTVTEWRVHYRCESDSGR